MELGGDGIEPVDVEQGAAQPCLPEDERDEAADVHPARHLGHVRQEHGHADARRERHADGEPVPLLETVEVMVFNDGRVRIQESTYHVPSERMTFTPAIELTGEEGVEEAQYRINEMRYYKAN